MTRFESDRGHLRAVAFRLTGSLEDADDVLQSTWIAYATADLTGVENLTGWLTTVVSRKCVDVLRRRRRRHEVPLDETDYRSAAVSPEDEHLWVESVGRALLVVLDYLTPAQRVAYVLHDMFSVPFDEIGPVLDRSPAAAKKLASRARLRIRPPGNDSGNQAAETELVNAYLNASRTGDIATLLELLAPDVVRTVDRALLPGSSSRVVRGRDDVADQTRLFNDRAQVSAVVLVDGEPAVMVAPGGRPVAAMLFRSDGPHIVEISVVTADSLARRRIALHSSSV